MSDMAFVEWKDRYSVQHGGIDGQHKQLIDLINQLHDAMRTGKASESLGPIVDKLVKYTRTHFCHEERLMAQAGYSGLEAHKLIHQQLVAKAVDLQKRIGTKQLGLSIQAMSFLRTWLTDHILAEDVKYVPSLSKAS